MSSDAILVSLHPPETLRAETDARWELHVTNRAAQPVRLTFRTAQHGDVVLERDGIEHYRWSEGRMFAQVIRERSLEPDETWVIVLEGRLGVEPGTYEAVGALCSEPEPRPARITAVVNARVS